MRESRPFNVNNVPLYYHDLILLQRADSGACRASWMFALEQGDGHGVLGLWPSVHVHEMRIVHDLLSHLHAGDDALHDIPAILVCTSPSTVILVAGACEATMVLCLARVTERWL